MNEEAVIKAAGRSFSEYSYEKTTVADILKTAGLSRATFYKWFSNKEDVYRKVLEREISAAYRMIKQEMEALSNPVNQMNGFWMIRLREMKKQPNLFMLLKQESLSPLRQSVTKELFRRDVEWMKSVLQNGMDAGLFVSLQPDLAATAMIHALNGFQEACLFGNEEVVEQHIRHLISLVFDGILQGGDRNGSF